MIGVLSEMQLQRLTGYQPEYYKKPVKGYDLLTGQVGVYALPRRTYSVSTGAVTEPMADFAPARKT